MTARVPVNFTTEEDTYRLKQAVEHVGLSASRVVEVFMKSMLSDESPARMERFVEVVKFFLGYRTRIL